MLALLDQGTVLRTTVAAQSPTFEGRGLDLSPDETRLPFPQLALRESDLRLAQPRQ